MRNGRRSGAARSCAPSTSPATPAPPAPPPPRKVGSFDPYSDDPRLAVKKVVLCADTGVLVVGGTAGQVSMGCLAWYCYFYYYLSFY